MKKRGKYVSWHLLNNSSFSFSRSNRAKNGFWFIISTEKKRKGLFWIQLKTIFFFYSFMKHCKSDATQNILCGFKPFKTVFLKKIERKFQNGMSFQMK